MGFCRRGFLATTKFFSKLKGLIGSEIPSDYIDFITEVNGGHPEVGSFRPLEDEDGQNLFDVDWFYSIDNPAVPKLMDVFVEWKDILGSKNLPIARDGGGNQIYLNFSDDVPTVWLYLHDEDGRRLKISNGFAGFLNGLMQNPDFI